MLVICALSFGCATPSVQPQAFNFATPAGPIGLSYSPDGSLLLGFRAIRNELQVLDAHSLEVRHTIKGKEAPAAISFASTSFSPDGRRVAVAGLDDLLSVWDTASWSEIRRFPESKGVTGTVMLPDGKRVAAVGPDNFVRLWDAESGAEVARLVGHTAPAISIALSPDGTMLATGSVDRTVRLWNVERREQIASFEGHIAPVLSLAFAPDGKTLASTAAGFDVLLWRLDASPPSAARLLDSKAEAEARSRSQGITQILLLISAARTYQLTGAPGGPILAGPMLKPAVNCPLAYSPDGRHIAIIHFLHEFAGSYHVEVYESATGKRVSKFSVATSSLAFSPDGRTVATSGMLRAILLDPLTGTERGK